MKRFMLQGVLLVGLALLGTDAFAQHGQARGKVVDEANTGVADAKVELEYLGGVTRRNEAKTNKRGEYVQVGLPPGQYKITVSKEGYRPAQAEYRINLGEPTMVPDIRIVKGTAGGGAGTPDPVAQAFRDAYAKAIEQAQAGEHDPAIAALRDLVAKYPGRAELWEVHLNLGRVLMQKKDWAAAETEIKRSLELRPTDNNGANLALADVYTRSGQKDKADALLTQAAASGGGDATVHLNLGISHLNAGRSAEAEASFRKAIEMNPSEAEAHFHLGTILVGQGKTPEAIASLEKYLTLKPTVAQNEATAKALIAALKK
jgi:Flp pilus assembly protein TadD